MYVLLITLIGLTCAAVGGAGLLAAKRRWRALACAAIPLGALLVSMIGLWTKYFDAMQGWMALGGALD